MIPFIFFSFLLFGEEPRKEETLFLNRIAAFWEEEEYSLAQNQIELFLKTFPDSSFASPLYAALGDLHLKEGKYQTALEAYSKIQDPSIISDSFLSKIQCFYRLGWFSSLADACEQHLPLSKEEHRKEIHYYAGIALYQQCREMSQEDPQAQILAQRAVPHFEFLLNDEWNDQIGASLAHLYSMTSDFSKAVSLYEQSIEKKPEYKDEYFYQIACLQAHYNPQLAIESFQKIREEKQLHAEEATYNRLILLFKLEQYETILEEETSLFKELAPEHRPSAHLLIGRCHIAQGNYQKASQELQTYLTQTSFDTSFHAALISLLNTSFHLSDLTTFHQTLQQFETNYPNDSELAKAKFCFALLLKKEDQLAQARLVLKELIDGSLTSSLKAEILLEAIQVESLMHNWEQVRLNSLTFLKTFQDHPFASSVCDHLLFASKQTESKELRLQDLSFLMTLPGVDEKFLKILYAETLCEMERYEEALTKLYAFLEESPPQERCADAYALIGLCHKGAHDLPQFCAYTEKAIQGGPSLFSLGYLHASLYNAYLELSCQNQADAHLLQAFQAGVSFSEDHFRYLADRLFSQCQKNVSPEIEKTTLSFFNEYLKKFPNSTALLQLAEIHTASNRFSDAIALLLKENSYPSLEEKQKRNYLLGQNYMLSGQKDEALPYFQAVLEENAPAFLQTKASFQIDRLWIEKWRAQGLPDEKDPTFIKVLCSLKDLSLQKNIQTEPMHLESALLSIELQTRFSQSHPEKTLALLEMVQKNFQTTEDLLSKDYHAVKEKLPEQNHIYELYMQLIESEALFQKSAISSELDEQKQLQAKSKNILLKIKEEKCPLDLSARIQRALLRYEP